MVRVGEVAANALPCAGMGLPGPFPLHCDSTTHPPAPSGSVSGVPQELKGANEREKPWSTIPSVMRVGGLNR